MTPARRTNRFAFSLVEYMAAALLASVVAIAAVTTIAPLRASNQASASGGQFPARSITGVP